MEAITRLHRGLRANCEYRWLEKGDSIVHGISKLRGVIDI